MNTAKYLCVVAIIASLTYSASAVHCYQCNSLDNPKCGEHFEDAQYMRIDCSRIPAPFFTTTLLGRNTNATGCVKKTLQEPAGRTYILRNCFYGDVSNSKNGCDLDSQNFGVQQLACDACSGDLCNSSTSMAPVAMAILMFFALARVFS
ncbi:uncharacterized protein LOC106096319 [Stomoxys calcitrans]|uniref:uncharacterized protein LOC106096319 n=1 Tax=Stomoxys calcitrans TaxID=35570 RepID=UPI0027E2B788|nr:uncharacterized protein LOC106096319 [Stomoxys calcitrans]